MKKVLFNILNLKLVLTLLQANFLLKIGSTRLFQNWSTLLFSRTMGSPGVTLLPFISFAGFMAFALAADGQKQFIHLKAVQCKFNAKFLANVSCFARSYSRTLSRAFVHASVKIPITSVMVRHPTNSLIQFLILNDLQVDFKMQYKYGTIYRDIMGIPAKFDWCFWMSHLKEFRDNLLANELIKVLDESVPGFVRPCPWKVNQVELFKAFSKSFLFSKKYGCII